MLDQAQALRNLVRAKEKTSDISEIRKARVITITSGKGGVGKSNIVVNLGITLGKQGKKVLIFDADIGMGNDDIILGVYPKYNVYDVIQGTVTIKDAIIDTGQGVSLLSAGSGLNKIDELSQGKRDRFINALTGLSDYDYILMDTGAGVSRTVLGFIAASDEVLLVTTPEPTSLTDAYSLIKAVKHFDLKEKAKVIINRSFTEEEAKETYNKFKNVADKFISFDLEYIGFIFDDRKLVESVRKQKPVAIAYPNSDSAKCLRKISDLIIGEKIDNSIGAEGFFKKLFKIFS
ncbi:MinD/ParA family protein [uncultured Clostridium sp.]|jgi:flagellar biosynthesis protein FlhG|uniref:MinD/ParA family protein n=1 Tax=uncultured Clostridium sp. TaxID=59620 RepID=UPI00262D77C0|nr:MinD/ParA family protein [uncultured Clostridium sp.]